MRNFFKQIVFAFVFSLLLSAFCQEFPPISPAVSSNLYDRVIKSIALIECGDSSGSGFVARMRNVNYLFTNKHVIRSGNPVVARLLDGQKLSLGSCQIADGVDLARFTLKTPVPALDISSSEPKIGQNVLIYGNSDGAGVATEIKGKVLGVSSTLVETDAPFVQGNSGSAIIADDGTVIGVATFARRADPSPSDWVKAGTRFSGVRRFGVRFNVRRWTPFDRDKIVQSEFAAIETPVGIGLRRFVIKGGDTFYFSGYCDAVFLVPQQAYYAPILHLSCIFEIGNSRVVRSVLVTKPNTLDSRPAPMSQAAIHSLSYNNPAISSYNQHRVTFGLKSLPDNRGFFSICTRRDCFNVPPKLIAYHLEVWSGGCIVADYSSVSYANLISKRIPTDWYHWNKYPNLFIYSEY